MNVLEAIHNDRDRRFLDNPIRFVQEICGNDDPEIIINEIYRAADNQPVYDDPDFVYRFLEYEVQFRTPYKYTDEILCHQKYIYSLGRLAFFSLFRKWYISEFIASVKAESISEEDRLVWLRAIEHVDLSEVRKQHINQSNKKKNSPFMIALYDVFRAMLPHLDVEFARNFGPMPDMPDRKAMLKEFAREFLWIEDVPVFHNPKSFDHIEDAIEDGKTNRLHQGLNGFDVIVLCNGRYAAVIHRFGDRVYRGITIMRFLYEGITKTYYKTEGAVYENKY